MTNYISVTERWRHGLPAEDFPELLRGSIGKTIKAIKQVNLDEDGNEGKSQFRNSERIVFEFTDGSKLSLTTFCSGSAQNTVMIIE